jgi:hypothetical protein
MVQIPPLPEDKDAQFEWFRSVVEVLRSPGEGKITDNTRRGIQGFAATHLPGHSFPDCPLDEDFAQEVLKLKDNDSSWNKALQSALVRAYENAESGNSRSAAQALESFATGCPWVLYAQVARNAAAQIAGSDTLS